MKRPGADRSITHGEMDEMDTMIDEIDRRTNLAFSNRMEMLSFYLTDSQQYGINVFKIIEVVETPKVITRIPHAHPAIVGAFKFRGSLVTVIDISFSLGMKRVDWKNGISYIIVCEYSNTTQGFLVSQPNKLLNIGWDDVKKPGEIVESAGYLIGITFEKDGQAVQILDIEKILGEVIGLDETISKELAEKSEEVDTSGMQVMVLDDSKAARGMMKNALDQLGIAHALFQEGHLALEALTNSLKEGEAPFSLILSDIEMPGMDGFTFTRKVKAIPELKNIPLVLHSSMSNKANRSKAISVGADGFVPKFQPDVIAGLVLERLGIVKHEGTGTSTRDAYFG